MKYHDKLVLINVFYSMSAEETVGFCARNLTRYDRPSHAEILVPPVLIIITILAGGCNSSTAYTVIRNEFSAFWP